MKTISRLLSTICLLAFATAAEGSVVVAVIEDGPSRYSEEIRAEFESEILALTEGEFELRFETFLGDWTRDGIFAALDRAEAASEVDLVLVTGLVANQILGSRPDFPKPIFLPLVFDSRLLGLPRQDGTSGKTNLNYLTDDIDFSVDLQSFLDIVDVERVGLLVDGIILEGIGGQLTGEARRIAETVDVEIVWLPYTDPEGDLVSIIPADLEAVMIGSLERLDEAAVERLIQGLIDRRIPSFSLDGDEGVRQGFLATNQPASDWQRLARTTALNIQAVLLGDNASDQPVEFESKRRLFLNMATARAIDVWPRYDVLVEATIFGEGWWEDGPQRTLGGVATAAVESNLDLLAQRYGTDAGVFDIREARAALLPRLVAEVSTTQLDGASAAVVSGAAAQRSSSASLTLSQSLWSESNRATVAIQERLQEGREADLEALRLDVVQSATVAFLDVLRAETQVQVQGDNLELTRANLELAEDRVRLGSSSSADVYRWRSELATARQNAITAHADRLRARENLNRLLHRPLDEAYRLQPPDLNDPALVLADDEAAELIDNPKALRQLTDFLVSQGVERSPELASLRAAIAAKQRELESGRRAFYLPDVGLQGQISEVLEEDRKVGLSLEGESDWSLGLVASLPLWSGGARRARVARAELELRQLETQYQSVQEQIEQGVRSSVHLANASYSRIELAREAAEAAARNLELVTDSYSQGVVSIIDLLDAQNASLQAAAGASNAVYDFLIDLMNLQRSTGGFDFFLTDAERQAARVALRTYFSNEGRDDE